MTASSSADLAWRALPRGAQVYVAAMIAAGAAVAVAMFPRTYPRPVLFVTVLAIGVLTAAWKVNLPIPLASGSTLSVSCSAKLLALVLLGPRHAVIVAIAGALTQCTYKARRPYPLYRTIFSMMSEAVAMAGTGIVYVALGGPPIATDIPALARPLVGAIATYFVLDTGLVAGAIALSTHRSIVSIWRDGFFWSGVTFMVAGTVGAMTAVIIERGYHWMAILLLGPLYLTYRTYVLFLGRLEDQQRHIAEMRRMHQETMDVLSQTREAGRALEQASRLKDHFMAIVSHELRTPLTAILGWSDILRSGQLGDMRNDRAILAIHDSATRQAELIDELLDVARIMSGTLRLDRTAVDVEDVVRRALNVVQPSADAKRIQLRLDVDRAAGTIDADRVRLQQIVWNLLSNAVKFTPAGGRVSLAVARQGDHIEITVTDTGEGIPREFLGSLFEPFKQADGSTTRHHTGLGLGLSIVKQLVDAHGGSIAARSAGQGQGATFVVRLPAGASQTESGDAPQWPASAPPGTAPSALLEGLSVLVVDDDEQGRQVIAAQLERHRAQVLTAASVAEALDVVQREHIDVLLADIAMPDEDGYALIHKLRALDRTPIASIPAAALTAFAGREDSVRALEAGFQLHLPKPIDSQSLVTAVARLGGRLGDRATTEPTGV
jgi:signal transduction histidine kinase/CheY-like chemotaxis protein